MPRLPCFKEPEVPPFYGVHAKLPLPVAIIMGFQHALAMMGGIITPPLLVSGAFYARFSNEESQYIVAVGLICSGILTWAQVYQVKLFRGLVLGTGMISVVGTSFVFVPIADTVRSFKAIVAGEYDHLPEAAFYMVGTIEEAVEKAKTLN